MRFLIQCVDEASVQVDRNVTGAIEKGFLVSVTPMIRRLQTV